MTVHNANVITAMSGIGCHVKRAVSINGKLLIQTEEVLSDQEKKEIADTFFMFRDVVVI